MLQAAQIKHKLARKRAGKRQASGTGFTPEPTRPTGAQVMAQWKAEGVFGAWATREDIEDSSAYARKLREQAQKREHK